MRRSVALALVLGSGLIGLAAGCGGEEVVSPAPETVVGPLEAPPPPEAPEGPPGDPAAGKGVFASAGCGSCHRLADAGTTGTIGPNLDDSQPELALVVDRVTNGRGAMPAFRDQLSEQQIADVSAYVVQATGGAAAPPAPPAEPPAPPAEPPPPPEPPAGGDTAAGQEVFDASGCGACHTFAAAGSSGTIGPNLDESLQGRDAAFVEESIVDPNAVIAEGFGPDIMPQNYADQLSEQQLADLVAFLTQS